MKNNGFFCRTRGVIACVLLFFVILSGCSSREYPSVDVTGITQPGREIPFQEKDQTASQGEAENTGGPEDALRTDAERLAADDASEAVERPEEISAGSAPAFDELTAAEEPSGDSSPETSEEAAEEYTRPETADTEPETEIQKNGHIVAIDAGGQTKADSTKEAVGPNSQSMTARMEESKTGAATGTKEYELTLAVARNVESLLVSRGYEVIMIRESNDVNLSNAERAAKANQSGAEILVRLHASFMDNSGIYGALAMCMTSANPYHPELYGRSYNLAKLLVDCTCASTGTKNRGVQETDHLAALNFSEIPAADLSMGYLSNPDEDLWLSGEDYRQKLADGITGAIDAYFGY